MKRFSIPLLLIGGALVVALQGAERLGWLPDLLKPADQPVVEGPMDDVLCGPRSLHLALNVLGFPVEQKGIVDSCKTTAKGVAFAELVSCAKRHGFGASLRRLQWDDLLASKTVCILYVAPAHYVAADARLESGHEDQVRLYEPQRVSRWVDRAYLEKIWSGESLVLSAAARSGDVQFETCWKDVGFIQAESQDFELTIRNTGHQERRFKVLSTSCNCTTASLTPEVLTPGGESRLRATIRLKDRRGLFQESVQIATDGKESPITLWFCGGRYADTLCRTHEYLGEFVAGDEFQRTIYVHDPGDESLSLSRESISVKLSAVESGGELPCDIHCDVIGPSDEDVGSRGLYVVKPGDYRITIAGRIPLRGPLQKISGRMTVASDLPPPLNQAEIGLSGRIVSRLRSEPPAVLVTKSAPTAPVLVSVTGPDQGPPSLVGFDCDNSQVSVHLDARRSAVRVSTSTALELQLIFEQKPDVASSEGHHSLLVLHTTAGDLAIPIIFVQDPADVAADSKLFSDQERSP